MNSDEIWRATERERLGLADLFELLTPEQWATPSLCEGWTVADVARHVTYSTRFRFGASIRPMLRGRMDIDRLIAGDVETRRDLSPAEAVAELRAAAGSRKKPPFLSVVDPLADALVHGQDVAVPLGMSRAMPPDAAVTALERIWSWPTQFLFHARRRAGGARLRATNAEWEAGDGPLVEGPVESLMLWLTGRDAGRGGLSGPGLDRLR